MIIFVTRAFVLTLLPTLVPYVYICEFSQNAVLITVLSYLKSSPCLIVKSSFLSLALKILNDLALTFLSNFSFSPSYSWLHLHCSPVVPMFLCPWGSLPSALNLIYIFRPSISSSQPSLPRSNFPQLFSSVSI